MPVLSKRKLYMPQHGALYAPAPGGGVAVTWTAPTANVSLSGGNLVATSLSGVTAGDAARSTTSHTSGKYYVEVTFTNDGGTTNSGIGVVGSTFTLGTTVGVNANGLCCYNSSAQIFHNSTIVDNFHSVDLTTGDVFCLAIDLDNRKIWARKNNAQWLLTTADPAINAGGVSISTLDADVYIVCDFQDGAGSILTANFGATAFTFTPPSGFGNW